MKHPLLGPSGSECCGFDLDLTGLDPGEIDAFLAIPDEERANPAPPLPENPVSRLGDFSEVIRRNFLERRSGPGAS